MAEIPTDEALVMALSYVLACQHIANATSTSPAYWASKFGAQAVEMLNSPEVSTDEIEKLCANTLNFDWEG